MFQFQAMLHAEPTGTSGWIERASGRRMSACAIVIVAGTGLYGAVMGAWREPLQAVFTAIKLPLAILLTTVGNATLNGVLAPLMGLNLTIRQTFTAVLITYAIAAALLGALAPVAAFVVWNAPPLTAGTRLESIDYAFVQLLHVLFIAVSGIIGNWMLLPTFQRQSGSRQIARRVVVAWLGCNLLLGSQISWLLRPFIWDPARPVEFLGPEFIRGSFYETVFEGLRRLLLAQF